MTASALGQKKGEIRTFIRQKDGQYKMWRQETERIKKCDGMINNGQFSTVC